MIYSSSNLPKAILFLERLGDRNTYVGHPSRIERDFSGNLTYFWEYTSKSDIQEVFDSYTIFMDNGEVFQGEASATLINGDTYSIAYNIRI